MKLKLKVTNDIIQKIINQMQSQIDNNEPTITDSDSLKQTKLTCLFCIS